MHTEFLIYVSLFHTNSNSRWHPALSFCYHFPPRHATCATTFLAYFLFIMPYLNLSLPLTMLSQLCEARFLLTESLRSDISMFRSGSTQNRQGARTLPTLPSMLILRTQGIVEVYRLFILNLWKNAKASTRHDYLGIFCIFFT